MIYLIQYKIKDDSKIRESIKSLGAWMNYFEGNWIVESNLNAQDIYDKISVGFDQELMLVMELKKTNYWGVMPNEAWDWIKKRSIT